MTATEPARLPTAFPGIHYYSSPEFDDEVRRIHTKTWWCVGHSTEWARSGDFKKINLLGESVLLVKDRTGTINGMVNICQHRGAEVCSENTGNVGATITCPYHGWAYRLDGRVAGAPSRDSFPEDVRSRRMPVVRTDQWLGFVWANLDPDAAPVSEHMAPMLRMRFGDSDPIARYAVETLEVAHKIDYGTVHANWKLLWENFSECYHCPAVHHTLCDAVPQFATGYGTVTGPQGQGARLAEGYSGFSTSKEMTGSLLPGLKEEDRQDFYGALLWPAAQLVCVADHVVMLTMIPEAANATRFTCYWLYQASDIASPNFDPMPAVDLFDRTNREDFEACERMQRGTTSKYWDTSQVYSPFEYRINSFHEWVEATRTYSDVVEAYESMARQSQPEAWSSINHYMR